MKIRPVRTRIFRKDEGLAGFIAKHILKLKNGSILAVTSKIVALAEGRVVTAKTEREKEKIIRAESEWVKPTKYVWLTMKDGMLLANAGVDESNADPPRVDSRVEAGGKLILLPKDSFVSAAKLRVALKKHYKLKKLGIVIIDSRIMPLRAGVVGVALGYAGFKGLRDYRGRKDIFGRKLKFTQTDIADSIATAATLVMGEGNERQPLAIIEDVPVEFCERVKRNELKIPLADDMYRPLFSGGQKR